MHGACRRGHCLQKYSCGNHLAGMTFSGLDPVLFQAPSTRRIWLNPFDFFHQSDMIYDYL